ncbi:hypothetical protein BaRGS_00014679 [Batillaria attramentaria]|uniref:UNC93-like protein n=1 Tax=Batillaria attramentaria TaxID=370345 RepID=A0ABD0L3C8_9CAEN
MAANPSPKERYLLSPPPNQHGHGHGLNDLNLPQEWIDSQQKSRRRSTIHSYTVSTTYHTLPNDANTLRQVRCMTEPKAMKNIFALSIAFMFVFTGFVSLQSLQSTLHAEGGIGVVLSCLLAPWLINRITTKWTMVLAFSLYFGYFAANFYPKHYLLIPLSVMLGALAGPMWSAQATYVTTLALTFAKHRSQADSPDDVINKFMGIFFGFFRSSQIWGNLISALVLAKNDTGEALDWIDGRGFAGEDSDGVFFGGGNASLANGSVVTGEALCGVSLCALDRSTADGTYNNPNLGPATSSATLIPDSTKYMLLTTYLACGLMGIVIVVALVDHVTVGKRDADPEFSLTSFELFMSTLKMLRDSKCCLLIPLVAFMGLEQGFMFSDFTKSYVSCTLGFRNIGPILICFGACSAVSSLSIGYVSRHIKRFAFIAAGATFNAGLLIVLALWQPKPHDIPNFYVVAGCLGLCDAIWQTQTYTLFGVLFSHKQEAAFASYRMFHATGCAMAFGYSYFLCVQTKVYILSAVLTLALALYTVIEMKVQLQSQHIQDIVAL